MGRGIPGIGVWVWQCGPMSRRRGLGGRSRGSSVSTAVPFATIRFKFDGTYHRSATEQLTLDIDAPIPRPMLVVRVEEAGTVSRLTNEADANSVIPLAQLGDILAQVLDFHEAFDLPHEPLPTN